MSKDDPFNLLWDFVYWVRKRRTFRQDAPVDKETLEFVAQGVERFLEGKNPWPKPRGRKAEPDMMWKCYYLTCVVDEHTEFPSRHFAGSRKEQSGKQKGIYATVGQRLGLSGQDIERHARNARKQLETPKGTQEYQDWLDQLEERWWCYHAVCIEKRALKLLEFGVEPDKDTLFLKHNELEKIVKSGQELRNTEEGMREYNEWLARYNRRDEDARIKPLRYRVFPFDHPESKALREQRAAAGLSNGKLKSTRIK